MYTARQANTKPSVFISYRRVDSGYVTDRILEYLKNCLPGVTVFRDLDSIPLGKDFQSCIEQALATCRVVLVVIGPHWLESRGPSGARRIDDPDDFVRSEILFALKSSATVIPLLVEGAVMPAQAEIPENIRRLATLNGTQIRRDPDFRRDMARVVRELKITLSWRAEATDGGRDLPFGALG